MIVYHGTTVPVETPRILNSGRMLDFGEGFYTTSNREQAVRWAQRVAAKRGDEKLILTEYEFDLASAKQELAIISFDKPDEAWLDFVSENRLGHPPSSHYDIAIGPVANDQVYATIVLYEQGFLSREATIAALRVRRLYDQILFHTDRSLSFCRFIRHTSLGGSQDGEK